MSYRAWMEKVGIGSIALYKAHQQLDIDAIIVQRENATERMLQFLRGFSQRTSE